MKKLMLAVAIGLFSVTACTETAPKVESPYVSRDEIIKEAPNQLNGLQLLACVNKPDDQKCQKMSERMNAVDPMLGMTQRQLVDKSNAGYPKSVDTTQEGDVRTDVWNDDLVRYTFRNAVLVKIEELHYMEGHVTKTIE